MKNSGNIVKKKLKLTPELSYLIGLWYVIRTKEGIGVKTKDKEILDTFSKMVLDLSLTEPDKLIVADDMVYFYHSKYKKFFIKVITNKLDKFKYINDYSGNFVAGLFDAVGSITKEGFVSLNGIGKTDELLLMRLGFITDRKWGKVFILKPKVFLRFISPYVRIKHIPKNALSYNRIK